jgi:hypothetical protein
MAGADATLIRSLTSQRWKAATLTRIWESLRDAANDFFRYLAEEMATAIFSGVSLLMRIPFSSSAMP